jgi:hypothetical protein
MSKVRRNARDKETTTAKSFLQGLTSLCENSKATPSAAEALLIWLHLRHG